MKAKSFLSTVKYPNVTHTHTHMYTHTYIPFVPNLKCSLILRLIEIHSSHCCLTNSSMSDIILPS